MPEYLMDIANEQNRLECDDAEIEEIVKFVLSTETDLTHVNLSIAVVDEELTQEVNRSFLDRTGTTDVISFPYGADEDSLEGEVVVNADEAIRQAEQTDHEPWPELLLYVVHGILHLLGYEDSTPDLRQHMNRRAVELLHKRGYELDSQTLLEDQ
jgi:probable rRNA maturation factor